KKRGLAVELSCSLTPVLPALLGRVRHLFDLNARPDLIADRLKRQAALARAVAQNPGLRVPGAFDGFELALRAVLGQQVTVKAATTLAGRLAETFGDPVETPYPELNRLSPAPERIAAAKLRKLTDLGIVGSRAQSLLALARDVFAGRLVLEAGAPPDQILPKLLELRGIGPWTAHYIAMRALRWPDAFPKEDLALRKKLGGASPAQAEALSQAWRPWRSYATLHLWGAPK
ncbi:MAG TPA: AlkA N-terminal domain-containing protein, partial [bacterium]|nr:AlkA N-terminal domain-containing protein [bacterium]